MKKSAKLRKQNSFGTMISAFLWWSWRKTGKNTKRIPMSLTWTHGVIFEAIRHLQLIWELPGIAVWNLVDGVIADLWILGYPWLQFSTFNFSTIWCINFVFWIVFLRPIYGVCGNFDLLAVHSITSHYCFCFPEIRDTPFRDACLGVSCSSIWNRGTSLCRRHMRCMSKEFTQFSSLRTVNMLSPPPRRAESWCGITEQVLFD